MSSKLLDEFLDELDDPIEEVNFDLDQITSNLPAYSNEKLCDMIVCDRYFGFETKISTICMEELSKRRVSGDTFIFEDYIDSAFKELPVLDFSIPDLRMVLNQAIGRKINK